MITPVILCGGTGTRLWPASRAARPKQFAALLGEESLFEATLARFEGTPRYAAPLVLAHHDTRLMAAEQARGRAGRILVEPAGRSAGSGKRPQIAI